MRLSLKKCVETSLVGAAFLLTVEEPYNFIYFEVTKLIENIFETIDYFDGISDLFTSILKKCRRYICIYIIFV